MPRLRPNEPGSSRRGAGKPPRRGGFYPRPYRLPRPLQTPGAAPNRWRPGPAGAAGSGPLKPAGPGASCCHLWYRPRGGRFVRVVPVPRQSINRAKGVSGEEPRRRRKSVGASAAGSEQWVRGLSCRCGIRICRRNTGGSRGRSRGRATRHSAAGSCTCILPSALAPHPAGGASHRPRNGSARRVRGRYRP
jgi:hypothetical protein